MLSLIFFWGECLALRISVRKLFFTERNTGLIDPSSYPVLGSAFKAAHIKMIMWFMTIKAVEFAETTGVPHLNLHFHHA